MPSNSPLRVKCPECGGQLKLKSAALIGKRIECPECETRIVVPDPEDDVDDKERPLRKKKKRPKASANKNMPFLIGAGVLLVAIVGVTIALLTRGGSKNTNKELTGDQKDPVIAGKGTPDNSNGSGTAPKKSVPLDLTKLNAPVWMPDPELTMELDDNPITLGAFRVRLPRGWQAHPDNPEHLKFDMQTYNLPYGGLDISWQKRDDLGFGSGLVSPRNLIEGRIAFWKDQRWPHKVVEWSEGKNSSFAFARLRYTWTENYGKEIVFSGTYYAAIAPPNSMIIRIGGNANPAIYGDRQKKIMDTVALTLELQPK